MEEREKAPTHLAIYHRQYGNHHQFKIVLGHEGKFQDTQPGFMNQPELLKRVYVEPIAEDIFHVVRSWLESRPPFPDREDPRDSHHRFLGSLSYVVEDTTAKTLSKFPKSLPNDPSRIILDKAAPGWGSHLEAECARQLEKLGIQSARSGDHTPIHIAAILEKAGLKAGKTFSIQEWYEKLEAYYKARNKR